MEKIIAFLGIVFLFFSCASSDPGISGQNPPVGSKGNLKTPSVSEQAKSGHWITRPSDNTLIIIGVSNLQFKRDSEITSAKEDAAQKAAMYHGIQGSIESFHSNGAVFFDYVADSKIKLDYDADHAKYIDRLTFDQENDVVITDDAVFVRFKYTTAASPVNFITSMNDDGRPNWTYSRGLPQVDGYITAVGFARNQVRLKDTIRKSTESAAARMIEVMSTQVMAIDKSETGGRAIDMIHTRSEGKLNNFQIIEFWIDPKTGYVYTLAIAKQGK
jgi:hypothetical protein